MEVLFEDVRSGEPVGWDAELNIPTNAHKTIAVLPASVANPADVKACGKHCRLVWLLDSASHKLLYLREWVLRAAPLSFNDETKVFLLRPTTRKANQVPTSFYLVDRSTNKMLYWRDDVVRVRPFSRHDPSASWRLRRVTESECPQWAEVLSRRNRTVAEWGVRIAVVVLGECDAACIASTTARHDDAPPLHRVSTLPRAIAPLLTLQDYLGEALRAQICETACRLSSSSRSQPHRLPGCMCSISHSQADCSCRGGVGPGPHMNVDATPLLHRMPALWRIQASFPKSVTPHVIVMLRRPELRSASHFQAPLRSSCPCSQECCTCSPAPPEAILNTSM